MKQYVGKGYTVYIHTNKANGKSYIGQTKREDLTRRWTGGHGYEGCPYFYNAIKKYGWNGFTHIILETGLTKEEADEKEIAYIKQYKTTDPRYGYNIKSGGHHDGTLTDETREKFSIIYAGENSPVKKSVDLYDLNGKYIGTFVTSTEASKFLGCSPSALSMRCKDKSGTLKGYICHFHETTNAIPQLPDEMIFKANEQRKTLKKVAQYDLEGNLINIFKSRKEAAIETGTLYSEIISCINDSSRKYANGYMWRDGSNAERKIQGLTKEEIENIQNETVTFSKPVIRTDAVTGEKKEFITQLEAAIEHGVTNTTVRRWIKLGRPIHGYYWQYKYA